MSEIHVLQGPTHASVRLRKVIDRPRILLVRPPQLFYFGVWPRGPRLSVPTGILAIGSYLKRKGLDVQIYDCFVEGESFLGDELAASIRQSARGLTRRWASQFESGSAAPSEIRASRGHLFHFGASWERLRRDLEEIRPDIVGITNLFRENTDETLKTADLVREVLPDAAIVVGGANATALPDFLLGRSSAIDVVGLGDGEDIMLELVEWVRGKNRLESIAGIVYRSGTGLIRTPAREYVTNLDEFGSLDYDLVRLERYFSYERNGIMARNKFSYPGSARSVSLVTSRGCPYKCSFCSIHIHAGRKFRRYSVENTLDHIENLVRRYGVQHLHFEDDNLTLDKPRFMQLMEGVLDRGLKFTWDTPNGVFANTLDEEMLRAMKKTGCIYLVIGVESGDQWVLDNVIHKQPLKLDCVLDVFRMGKRVGLDLQAFYIIGFPRETMAHIRKTTDFAFSALREYDVIPHLAIARADPGTELYAEAVASGNLVTDHTLANMSGVHSDMFERHMIRNDEFEPETLEAISSRFHARTIRAIGMKTAVFLLRHPMIALRSLAYFMKARREDHAPIRDSIVKLFFCRLFYRNALLREQWLAGPSTSGGPPGESSERGVVRESRVPVR